MLDLRPRLALITAALALAGCFNPTGQGASAGSSSGSTADTSGDATTTTAGTTSIDPTTGGTASTTTTATSTSATTGTASTVSSTSDTSTSSASATSDTTDPSTSTSDTSTSNSATTIIPESCGDGVITDGEQCDDGNESDEDVCLSNCTLATCGDGHVQAGVEECDLGPDNAPNGQCNPACEAAMCGDMVTCPACGEHCDGQIGCTPFCQWEHLYIFVASKTVKAGEIGGLDGGDQRCQQAAAANPMFNGRKFVAWLSTSAVDAGSRIGNLQIDYLRTDNLKLAGSTADLLDAVLSNPIGRDESGAAVIDMKPVWTGTLANGIKNGGDTLCGDWTELDSVGRTGDYTSVSNLWTDQGYVNCDQDGHIYCVQSLL